MEPVRGGMSSLLLGACSSFSVGPDGVDLAPHVDATNERESQKEDENALCACVGYPARESDDGIDSLEEQELRAIFGQARLLREVDDTELGVKLGKHPRVVRKKEEVAECSVDVWRGASPEPEEKGAPSVEKCAASSLSTRSPSVLERIVRERESASSPYSPKPRCSPPDVSPENARQKKRRQDDEEDAADISDPGQAIKKIWANSDFYKQISPDNPIKREPKVVRSALQSDPDLFFSLPTEFQIDSILKKLAYLSAKKKNREELCHRLLAFDVISGTSCLSSFESQISDIVWSAQYPLAEFFRNGPESRDDRELFLSCMCLGENIFAEMGPALRQDKEFLMLCSEMGFEVLQYASSDLKNDKEFVFALVWRLPQEIIFASAALQEDRAFLLEVASRNGNILAYVSKSFKKDRELVLASVHQNGMMLGYADMTLRDDIVVVRTAMMKNPEARRFASSAIQQRIRFDKEFAVVSPVSPNLGRRSGSRLAHGYED